MKYPILTLMLVSLVFGAEDWKPRLAQDVSELSAKCLKENNVSKELIAKLKDFDFADETSIHCSIKCISENIGIWDAMKGYDIDRTYEQTVSQGSIASKKEELGKCIDMQREKESDCEWAFRNFKCWIDNKLIVPNKA